MTRKQANVIYALTKKGLLNVNQKQMTLIYNEADEDIEYTAQRHRYYGGSCRTHGITTYLEDEKRLMNCIFNGDYDKANSLIIDLFGYGK